jgi:Sulfotransferase family
MLVSHRRRFIFIHIYKVAGSSVRDALSPFAHDGRVYGISNKHLTAAQIRSRIPFPLFYDRYFKFAFVRNPWSFEASLYNFAKRTSVIPKDQSFETFLDGRKQRRSTDGPQAKFVLNANGDVIVDHIGRMEQLEADFAEICRKIGFSESDMPKIPHSNQSTFEDWRPLYTERTKELVAEISAKDIRMFDYKFED